MCWYPKKYSLVQRGFTLVEVMVVVALIGVMAAITVPNILTWLPNTRLKGAARDLYSAAMATKMEAVKRGQNCVLIFNQPISGTTYAYMVFVDADKDCEYDAGETVLSQVEQWPKKVFLDTGQGGGDGLSFTNNDDSHPAIVFLPTAIPTANGGGFANGSAWLKNSNGRGMTMAISRSGTVSVKDYQP